MKKLCSKVVLIFSFVVVLLCGVNAAVGSLWDTLGSGIDDLGGYHYMAVHTDGTPYVAYRKVASGPHGASFYFKALKYDYATNSWIQLGDDNSVPCSSVVTDIAVSPQGECYVAFSDDENLGKLSVMKYNGIDWENVGSRGISDYNVSSTHAFDLKIAQNGTPYLAYQDGLSGELVTIKKFNGIEWKLEGAPLSSGNVEQKWVTMTISSKSVPYVTFTKEFVNANVGKFTKTIVVKFNGIDWINLSYHTFVTAWDGITQECLAYPTLAISNRDEVYIAYLDYKSFSSVIVKKNDGISWNQVASVLDNKIANAAGDENVSQYPPALAVSSAGHPYVTLKAGVAINGVQKTRDYVMTFNEYDDKDWKIVGSNQTHQNFLDGFCDGTAAYSTLGVDMSGVPYVAYQSGQLFIKKYNHK
jgi:hypothetical protein